MNRRRPGQRHKTHNEVMEQRRQRMQDSAPAKPVKKAKKGKQPKLGEPQSAGTPQKINTGNTLKTQKAARKALKTPSQQAADAATDKANKQNASRPDQIMAATGITEGAARRQALREFEGRSPEHLNKILAEKGAPVPAQPVATGNYANIVNQGPPDMRSVVVEKATEGGPIPSVTSKSRRKGGSSASPPQGSETQQVNPRDTQEAVLQSGPRFTADVQASQDRANDALQEMRDYKDASSAELREQQVDGMRADNAAFARENDALIGRMGSLNTLRAGGKISGETAQQQGMTQELAEGLGGTTDYTDYVKNYQVPESILRENASYGEGLRGKNIELAGPEYGDLAEMARGGNLTAADTLSRQKAGEGYDEEAQKNLIESIMNDPERAKAPRDPEAQRAERRAKGDQRQADSQEARSRGITPEQVANERALLDVQRQATAIRDATKQTEQAVQQLDSDIQRYKTQAAYFESQIGNIQKELDADLDAPQGQGMTPEERRARKGEVAAYMDQIRSLMQRQVAAEAKKGLVQIPPSEVAQFEQLFKSQAATAQYMDIHNMTPQQALDQKYGPGTSERFMEAYINGPARRAEPPRNPLSDWVPFSD